MNYVISAFNSGGGFMYVILLALVIGLAIMIERFIYIRFKNRIDATSFVNRVLEFIQGGNFNRAVEYCSISNAALPKIAKAGLLEHGRSPEEMQSAFELAAMVEIPKLEKRTHYLSMIANVATLLGLLGTIFGLITSFQAVAHADAADKATLLAGGISMAMNTTAFGLIVAIPCLIGYAYLVEKTNEAIDEINQNIARIYKKLTFR